MSRHRRVLERRSENQHLWLKILSRLNDYTLDEVRTMCLRYQNKRAENKERRERTARELKEEDKEKREIWRKRLRKIKDRENRKKKEESSVKNTVVSVVVSVLFLLTQGCVLVPIGTEVVKHGIKCGVKNVITTGQLFENAIKISKGEPSFKETRREGDTVFVLWHIKVRVEAPCRCNVDTTATFFDHDDRKVKTDSVTTEFLPGEEKNVEGVVELPVNKAVKIRELKVNIKVRNIVKK